MDKKNSAQWFRTKVDWWLAAILILLPLFVVGATLFTAYQGHFHWASLAGCGLVLGIYAGLIFPMRYGISQTELIVRHGLVRQRCKLSDIRMVSRTRNPLSSPALSLNRLKIATGSGVTESIMISPADRDGFLKLLAERSSLVADGDGLKLL